MLFSLNLHEHFIDEKRIAEALMFVPLTLSVFGTKLIAPKTDRFVTDRDTAFSQQVFNVAVIEAEAVIEPDGVLNDFSRESITLIYLYIFLNESCSGFWQIGS
jgi:hypothetical protein